MGEVYSYSTSTLILTDGDIDDMDNKILVKTGHYFTRSKIDEDKLIVANVVSNDFNDFLEIHTSHLFQDSWDWTPPSTGPILFLSKGAANTI